MTEKMENALNHIKTSVDVDPWAMEEVERVFKMFDDIRQEIYQKACSNYGSGFGHGLNVALKIIDKHIGVQNEQS